MGRVTRRELLAGFLGAPFAGGFLAACDGEPTAPEVEGKVLGQRMGVGHLVRDRVPSSLGDWERAPRRRTTVAIVGGGAAGLSAAWRLGRAGVGDFRVFELEGEPGGTSRSGSSPVTAYPWGAHYLPLPQPDHPELIELLREMGAVTGVDAAGLPVGAEELLVRQPEERVFHRGFWYEGLWLEAGADARDRAELARFRSALDDLVRMRDPTGARAFAIPIDRSHALDDPAVAELDGLTAADWLAREGLTSERLRWLVDYACRDDYGLSATGASALAALWYWAARIPAPGAETMDLLAWPEGNGALVSYLARSAGDRLLTDKLVVDVHQDEERVVLHVLDAAVRRPEVWIADHAIVAAPRFVARRVVRELREGSDDDGGAFRYGAWMVANLHLAGRPSSRGFPPCWDNVLYDSPSLGYVTATHQRGRDFGPTVLTYYLPLTDDDERAGRRRLLEPTWEEWKEVVVADLSRAHPDLPRLLRRLDVFRWGHGMVQPRPGVLTSAARRRAARPLGRIRFAHSDLSGLAIFEHAFHHGVRAAVQSANRSG